MTDEIPEKKQSSVEKKQVLRWRCPNCGQIIFATLDDELPDICAFCRDMTTWQRVDDEATDKRES